MANINYTEVSNQLNSLFKSLPRRNVNKVVSAPRKPKSVSRAKAISITPKHRQQKAIKEFHHFLDTATEAEIDVIRHLKPLTFDPEDLMKEIRRLLGESIKRCVVIPFPQHLVRKRADFVSDRNIKIESVVIEL